MAIYRGMRIGEASKLGPRASMYLYGDEDGELDSMLNDIILMATQAIQHLEEEVAPTTPAAPHAPSIRRCVAPVRSDCCGGYLAESMSNSAGPTSLVPIFFVPGIFGLHPGVAPHQIERSLGIIFANSTFIVTNYCRARRHRQEHFSRSIPKIHAR